MPKDKSTGKKLADMLYGNPERAAFGVFPQMKPKRSKQDPEAAKNFPVDLARGVVAGALGIPGDIESLARLPYELYTGNDSPTILPTSEDVLKRIPFGSDTPASQFAAGLGTLAGGSANLGAIPRAVKAAPGALKAAARNISEPRTLNPQAGVFIGPKAKTFHQGKADMAVAMEEAGRTPQEIWLATGTFRGADGILRQEIDDRAAKFLSADERKERIEAAKGKIAEMKEKIKPTPQKDLFPKALTEAKKEVRDDISILKSDVKQRENNPRTQGLLAQHIFEHPELYAAYPELQNVKIVTEGGSGGGARGSLSIMPSQGFYPGSMEMDIYDKGLRSNPTSTALHEMQHAVQTLEGMGPGGNPTFAFSNPEAHEILKKLREETYKPSTFEQFQRVNKFPEDEAQAAYEQYLKERKANPITSDKVERAMQETAAMEYYKRLLGEAEARAVQDRQIMTPAQRMETPPPASYDVPQEDLIVKPPREYADGGRVHFSDNPDVMALELQAGGLVKGLKAAAKAAKPAEAPMKASEALGRIEGRPLVITQADRTKVGGGFLGGPGFSGLQLEDPAYRAAEAAWGVKTPGVAKMILGGGKTAGKDPVYAAMLGTPTQHQSNQMVFDKLYGDFKKSAKKGSLDSELRDRINMRLANTVDKEGNPIFPPDVDILGKNFKDLANTFDRRAVTANLIGGMGVGGKKGQIIDYDKIIRETTDPLLIDAPTGALGNRLFTLSGGIIERPDLHPAFPTILQGEDLGVSFDPVARELIMKDFMERTMREKGRTPGYMDYTRGYPPSQLITEDLLTELQKMGKKAGGAVRKAAGGEITADDLILEERKL